LKDLSIHTKIWLNSKDKMLLGEGRVALLQAIQDYGSINKAAKSMSMSYAKAWKLIDSMNVVSESPLVETVSGGKGGGGTKLTTEGEKLVELFKALSKSTNQFLEIELQRVKEEMSC